MVLGFQPVSHLLGQKARLNHVVQSTTEHSDIRQLHPVGPSIHDLIVCQTRAMPPKNGIAPQHGFQPIYRWIIISRSELRRPDFPIEKKVVISVEVCSEIVRPGVRRVNFDLCAHGWLLPLLRLRARAPMIASTYT